MSTLVDSVQRYLIANGVGRDPRVNGSLPPIWRQPVDGTPAPGEGSGNEVGDPVVIGLMNGTQVPRRRNEEEWRRDNIDFWVRSRTWPQTTAVYVAISALFIGEQYRKVDYVIPGMRIIESTEWRGLGMIESNRGQGYTSLFSVLYQTYAVEHS